MLMLFLCVMLVMLVDISFLGMTLRCGTHHDNNMNTTYVLCPLVVRAPVWAVLSVKPWARR